MQIQLVDNFVLSSKKGGSREPRKAHTQMLHAYFEEAIRMARENGKAAHVFLGDTVPEAFLANGAEYAKFMHAVASYRTRYTKSDYSDITVRVVTVSQLTTGPVEVDLSDNTVETKAAAIVVERK